MEFVALSIRFALGGLFLVAGAAKLTSLDSFEAAVRDYKILPARLVRPVSRVVPLAEFAAGALMALGIAIPAVAVVMAGLMIIFATAIAINLLRGRTIDCGWSGAGAGRFRSTEEESIRRDEGDCRPG